MLREHAPEMGTIMYHNGDNGLNRVLAVVCTTRPAMDLAQRLREIDLLQRWDGPVYIVPQRIGRFSAPQFIETCRVAMPQCVVARFYPPRRLQQEVEEANQNDAGEEPAVAQVERQEPDDNEVDENMELGPDHHVPVDDATLTGRLATWWLRITRQLRQPEVPADVRWARCGVFPIINLRATGSGLMLVGSALAAANVPRLTWELSYNYPCELTSKALATFCNATNVTLDNALVHHIKPYSHPAFHATYLTRVIKFVSKNIPLLANTSIGWTMRKCRCTGPWYYPKPKWSWLGPAVFVIGCGLLYIGVRAIVRSDPEADAVARQAAFMRPRNRNTLTVIEGRLDAWMQRENVPIVYRAGVRVASAVRAMDVSPEEEHLLTQVGGVQQNLRNADVSGWIGNVSQYLRPFLPFLGVGLGLVYFRPPQSVLVAGRSSLYAMGQELIRPGLQPTLTGGLH
ncbi:hypothetical protein 1 [Beihai tombus-like virus 5]|uniref:hypothetical protein 1 n=1 Tax=Beihai tombus-like virus 5 TaxID=1922726 RepID=UPI00090B09CE|nr:hypothetical protein 1 [Beihai tombus-like virus 5]APG76293.1 hypothetical protein 1 [Beihai tombus-like virus 5]